MSVNISGDHKESNSQRTHNPMLEAVLRYRDERGFAPIYINRINGSPSKGGLPKDWPNFKATDDKLHLFTPDRNVGLILGAPSRGLTDTDLDCPEAVFLAPFLLPRTHLISGRARNPRSHYWHIVDPPDVRRREFAYSLKNGPAKEVTLVEFRATGCQTLAPPSVHPEGDLYEWNEFGEATKVKAADLIRCVQKIAIGALLARSWTGEDNRHDLGLCVAGLFLGTGWEEEEAAELVFLTAQAAGHKDPRDRKAAVHSTYRNAGNGRQTRGIPKLKDYLPDEVVDTLVKWCQEISPNPHFWERRNGHSENKHEDPLDDSPPLDIFGDTAIAGEPDLPKGVLPKVIDDFARDEAARLGCDPIMVALPALVAAAAAIHDAFQVQPKKEETRWLESARIWGAVIHDPGEKHTPAQAAAIAPLREIERQWFIEDDAAIEQYHLQESIYKYKLEAYAKRCAKGESAQVPEKPPKPIVRRRTVGDTTTEALSNILTDNAGGVLAVFDELSGWFASFDAYRGKGGGKDRALWLEAYNGGPQLVDRVLRGRVLVQNWSVGVVGGIQPGPARRLAGKITDDGLPQRLIVAFAKPGCEGLDRLPDRKAILAYGSTISRLVNMNPEHGVRLFTLSEAAQSERALVSRIARNLKVLPSSSAPFKAHLGKWDGFFARLALTFHMVEHNPPPTEIPGETAKRVATFMVDYLLPNAARFYTEILGQRDNYQYARWIAGHILTHKLSKITARDVGRAYRELRGDLSAIQQAMTTLLIAGWGVPLDGEKRQGPTKWEINPQVHTIFAPRAEAERLRREEVKRQIREAARSLGLSPEDDAEEEAHA